ncbi:hypothetical protein SAY86_013969 [Trapa natans]|uniref:AP2/ERF domain-containing protein n=1 Tax=Trapa natans TaxID=22666 RepID=A0AAN7KT99_TRANT|nr:hypothetical protein SAY86_013969 [Trapa natans]
MSSTGCDTEFRSDTTAEPIQTVVTPKRDRRSGTGSSQKHREYLGVRMRSWGRWVSEIREPRKKSRIWLGSFKTAEMAAMAHDAAALALKGSKYAVLNFPELAASLPRPVSTAAHDIQAAATKAASMDISSILQKRDATSRSTESGCGGSSWMKDSDGSTGSRPMEAVVEEELGEIVQLPRLGTSFDCLVDSLDHWWMDHYYNIANDDEISSSNTDYIALMNGMYEGSSLL